MEERKGRYTSSSSLPPFIHSSTPSRPHANEANRRGITALALVLLALMLGSLTIQPAAAQSVEEHFHRGAQAYIAEDYEEAEAQVEAGLRLDPSNEKLQALREKLEQERQQQGGGSSDDDQQRPEPSGDQDAEAQEGESEEEEERQNDQQQDEQGGSEQQEEEPQNEGEEEEGSEESEGDIGPGLLPEDPNELSREQAERILQALRDQEEQLLNQVLRREERSRHVEKEW